MASATTVQDNTTTTVERPALTLADRCDRCGAQAFVRAVLLAGEILMCGHHGKKHMAELTAQAVVVDDFTHMINAKSASSA